MPRVVREVQQKGRRITTVFDLGQNPGRTEVNGYFVPISTGPEFHYFVYTDVHR